MAIQVSPGAVSATSAREGSSPVGSMAALGEWIVLEPGVGYALLATSSEEVTVVFVQVLVE